MFRTEEEEKAAEEYWVNYTIRELFIETMCNLQILSEDEIDDIKIIKWIRS